MNMIWSLCLILTASFVLINMYQNEKDRDSNVIAIAAGMLVSGIITALCTLAGIK